MSLLNNVAKFTERPAKSGWHSLGVDKKNGRHKNDEAITGKY